MKAIAVLNNIKHEKEQMLKKDISIFAKKIVEKETEEINEAIEELETLQNRKYENCLSVDLDFGCNRGESK